VKLCLNTDSLGTLPLPQALDFAAGIGIESVEIAAGGHSVAPHMRIADLLSDASKRAEFANAITSRELRLDAINCSADPLHPVHGGEHLKVIQNSIRLAGLLGVDKIVSMSGCPGDSPQARTINWIWFPWPKDMQQIREEQWDVAMPVWGELAELAQANGVTRIALELLPLQLVYNVPTLLRLREAVGPVIGANIDPSHMFWQQMDPLRVVAALGPAVHHVHLKDTQLDENEVALNGVLDFRSWDDPAHRSWVFRTVGEGHPASFWKLFLQALVASGYDDVLSIENEDPLLPGKTGVARAVDFISSLIELERPKRPRQLLGEPAPR
jgi:sugar phosphate isomerase/epimerase